MTIRVAVFGAGAIGSLVAARLSLAGNCTVSVLARGEQLSAIHRDGILLHDGEAAPRARPHATTASAAELPPQDLVIVALKACSLPAAAADISAIMKPEAPAVFILNGIPWWYESGQARGSSHSLLDPGGTLRAAIGAKRALGCLTYAGARVLSPGVTEVYGTNKWLVGNGSGERTEQATFIAETLSAAGLGAEAVADFRHAMWRKLMLNLALNPLCALTRHGTRDMLSDPELKRLARKLVEEALPVAAAHGCDLAGGLDLDAMLDPATRPRDARPSMLQDVEAGRPMEVEAIVGQVEAFARELGLPRMHLSTILSLLRGLDRKY